jgi:hypothetical protein
MSLTGFIQRPDGAPLGSEEEVMRQLASHFPGVQFTYYAELSPAQKEVRKQFSLFLKLYLYFFGWEVPYPKHIGDVQNSAGWAVQFEFVAQPTVPWVAATSYGMTAGLDEYFERLQQTTGWETHYPP